MERSGAKLAVVAARPHRRSVRSKLVFLVICSVGVAVALVAGVSAWRDGVRDAALQTERLGATTTVMSSLSAEATAANDRLRAFRTLRAIAQMPGVEYARIERADGSPLVEVGGGARLIRDVRVDSGGGGRGGLLTQLQSRSSEVSAPIRHEGRLVGRLVLLGRTEGVAGRFMASLGASLLAASAAVLIGLMVAWRLQRGITRPILALIGSMREVERGHDYDRAVQVEADDEIGELVDGFNHMLGEIRARDRRIAEQVAGLESDVAARTADLKVAKEAAEAANSAKSDFLATMSHEIRTPMNGIMVMAEMLAAGEMPPRQRRFAEVIAKSGSSLLAIINDILDFSKIEAGKMDLEAAPVDLAEVVEDVCSLFWERAASKGLDLAAYVDPALPRRVAADPVRLRQVIGNLVNNAIKFTEAGGVLIEVERDPGPQGSPAVRISVHDTGIGIPKHKIAGVFGAFEQADQSTTRRFGGTGLGLAICKRLVEAMGGRFKVTSEVGRGSTFAFRLPMQALEPATSWAAPAAGATVLVADPGRATTRALGRYLRQAGFKVVAAPSEAGAGDPMLAFATAATLPAMAGVAAPKVCLASFGESEPYAGLRRGDVAAVMVKPVRRVELEGLLQRLAAGAPLHDDDGGAADAGAPVLPAFAGARVLVADDSAVNREVAFEALARLGVAPTLVNDGEEAVRAAAGEPFDLILMDGSMPGLDGYEAARAIRRREAELGGARTPIVALTAHVVGAAAEAWREAGMDAVLHKPFTLTALAQLAGRFLQETQRPPPQASVVSAPPPATGVGSELIDPEVAAQLAELAAGGRSDFVAKVHGLYRDNAPDCLVRLDEAAAAADAPAASRAAHALKSMSFNVGARVVSRQAAEIEAAARDGRPPTLREVAAVREALDRTLAELQAPAALPASAAPHRPAPLRTGVTPARPAEVDELLRDLERALEEDQLFLVYQPQMDREGEQIVGVETLIRWRHPDKGLIRPDIFIPVAEQHGMIDRITSWVLNRALAETRFLSGLQVAVNVSALEFSDPGFAPRLGELLAKRDYDPRRLEIEITETAILQNQEQVRENMDRLHERGIMIALDDFGAGYSSLGHLRRYPFDKLKIDREFITDCSRDMQSATVVHAVVSIGRALGMKVVAEGVETETQRKFLKIAGVHAMQGFLFGKPVGIDQLSELVKGRASHVPA